MRTRFCAALTMVLLLLAGCGGPGSPAAGAGAGARSATGAGLAPAADPGSCAAGTADWDCSWQRRFADATTLLARQPGRMAVVLQDRVTRSVWRAGETGSATWTASTIKLAIATNLLERQRSGQIVLDAADLTNLTEMLNSSSNDAATALWDRYDGPGMLDRFRTGYGMSGLSVAPGYGVFWRHLFCTAEDLRNLMAYVLEKLPTGDRTYLVNALRAVAANQHWGVWAAGPAQLPGNKDGWAFKPDNNPDHWVTHTVGFAGPGERYIVVVMDELPGSSSMADGVHAVSDLVALLFGAPTPATVELP